MIVAGEASGDAHAAALVRAIQDAAGAEVCEFFGSTGPLMRAAGVESIIRSDDLAILGLLEIGRALPRFWRAYRQLKRAAIERQPDAVILVDWPDFNLRLARSLHRRGTKIIYYISPQLWAWRPHRIRNVRRDVDLLISILPFEKDWYAARGMTHVAYVGHPMAGRLNPKYGREEFCRQNDLDPSRPIVALLPGSRHKELSRILPEMLGSAAVVWQRRPEVQFVIPLAAGRDPEEARQLIAAKHLDSRLQSPIRVTRHETIEALAAADVAAVASGTATLEAALVGTPLVIVYKESALNWHTLGRLITADHYGLVNLIAGRRMVTELMQNDFTAECLAEELMRLLDPDCNRTLRAELRQIAESLGDAGASRRAAELVINTIR